MVVVRKPFAARKTSFAARKTSLPHVHALGPFQPQAEKDRLFNLMISRHNLHCHKPSPTADMLQRSISVAEPSTVENLRLKLVRQKTLDAITAATDLQLQQMLNHSLAHPDDDPIEDFQREIQWKMHVRELARCDVATAVNPNVVSPSPAKAKRKASAVEGFTDPSERLQQLIVNNKIKQHKPSKQTVDLIHQLQSGEPEEKPKIKQKLIWQRTLDALGASTDGQLSKMLKQSCSDPASDPIPDFPCEVKFQMRINQLGRDEGDEKKKDLGLVSGSKSKKEQGDLINTEVKNGNLIKRQQPATKPRDEKLKW